MQHSFLYRGFFAAVILTTVVATAAPAVADDWKEAAIAEVKASHFEEYEEEWPVGRILELKFEDRGWMASETKDGTRLVEFQGTITPETNLRALQWWAADIDRQPGSYAAELMGWVYESIGEERARKILNNALDKGMSNHTAMAVLLGVAFPDYWGSEKKAGILWRQMEDGYWLLETMASDAWGGLNHDQIIAALLY